MDDPAAAKLAEIRAALLAQTPLADMATWAQSGRPPPSAELRDFGFRTDGPVQLRLLRFPLTRRFGFAIPCAEAIEALAGLSPLLEIGAGAGYWAAILRARGCDIRATDLLAEGDIGYGFEAGRWTEVEARDAAAAVRDDPERNLFCCWPTEGAAWALEAARALRPGRRLAVVGAGLGGSTATDDFWRYLAEAFEPRGEIAIPQFPGCSDRLWLFERGT